MTAQLMNTILIGGQEYRVASQIHLPQRRSKRWKHIIKVPPAEWQPLFCSTACWRRYVATWEIADDKLLLKFLDGCYELKENIPFLFAEWVTSNLRIVVTDCWFLSFDFTFELEYSLPVVSGVVSPSAVATILSSNR